MFSDPQSITVNSVAKPMPRIKTGSTDSTYRTADGSFSMRISHQETKSRSRRMARIDQTIVAADPITAINKSQSLGVYLVVDEPLFGFDDTAISYVVTALKDWLTSPNILKLLGSES
jgi:hypothetical protein